MTEKKTSHIKAEISPASPSYLPEQRLVYDYKTLSFFLEKTSETIHKTTVMIQQLESEVARLRYEVMATENEYKNLKLISEDLELKVLKIQNAASVDSAGS